MKSWVYRRFDKERCLEALDAAAEEERTRTAKAAYQYAHEFSINVNQDLFVKRILDKLGR